MSADAANDERQARLEAGIQAVREGHGANCSSIGSVIDSLFAGAVIGGALFAALAAALAREEIKVVGSPKRPPPEPPPPPESP
ncbi:MAG TPA: hypothetical protein VGI39_20490 [Polyangiaceae bacterium]|jgi:hypothetical protein